MSFGGFLDNGSGARVVADLPYNSMPTGTIVQPRLVAPALAKSMFNSPSLSLALQTNTDGQGEMNRSGGGDFELPATRNKEEEYESRSGSDNMDGASGDDQDADNPPRKKRYHRHTPQQIQDQDARTGSPKLICCFIDFSWQECPKLGKCKWSSGGNAWWLR